jgi:POT family proton-dependent oligopeptide transporter
MYTGIACASGVCAVLVYVFHHKNDDNDVADDAIGIRSNRQAEEYNRKQATIEYEAEKGEI